MALTLGVLALVEAKPGKEAEVETRVPGSCSTNLVYGFRVNDSTFGIFDAFDDDEARQAHLSGQIPAALAQKGPELFSKGPRHPPWSTSSPSNR